jgi:pimeloyl-ACP methyl ester carboxylesterase
VLVLVTGALGRGPDFAELAQRLDLHFTVVSYDRRGRGESGDTPPYAVAREVEDLEAIIDSKGGTAFVYGISSGAALALHTAAAIPNKITKLALYEMPVIVNDLHAPLPADYVPHLQALIEQGKRSDAVDYFMSAAVGVPQEYITPMHDMPMWAGLEAVAHTISYDGMVMGDTMAGKPLSASTSASRWPQATMPILVMDGSEGDAFMASSADALAAFVPHGHRLTLEGQNHDVKADPLAAVLIDFFLNQH